MAGRYAIYRPDRRDRRDRPDRRDRRDRPDRRAGNPWASRRREVRMRAPIPIAPPTIARPM
jgi:hypothetical protein